MVEREFQDAEGAEAIRSSHGDFRFVVQPLHHAAGKLLAGLEVVQQQRPVGAQRAGDFFHGFNAAAHGLAAPEVQEHAGPGGRVVFPELLEIFLEQIGANAFEVVAKQIAEALLLLGGEILFPFEDAPAGLFQHRLMAVVSDLAVSAARTSSRALFILATM